LATRGHAVPPAARRGLALQRAVAHALAPLSTLAVVGFLRFGLRLSLEDAEATRSAYRRIWRESRAPLLVCANHLTMIDSALVAWALGSPLWYVGHFSALPWNVPERTHFASTRLRRALAWIYKCLPIVRGGRREDVAGTLARFSWLLSRGEAGLIFPEGGRSRSGRVDLENAAWGVGRVVRGLPGCRVLCVYLRGDHQEGYSALPARGDRLRVRVAEIEPKSDLGGLRGSREVARQIAAKLAQMEEDYFRDRQ